MKKYLVIFTVLCTVILSSCSNDDVTMCSTTTFTIQPSTVINPLLECEIQDGELETLPAGFALHVQLLIYNSDGVLVRHEEETHPNYTSLMKCQFDLPVGEYRALAITDVQAQNQEGTINYWEFEHLENLSGATIKSTKYLGYQWKILGLQSGHFTVEERTAKDIKMSPTAYGTLFVVGYNNIFTYNDITLLGLASNRASDKLVFNSVGNPTLTVESNNNEYMWWNNYITLADESSSFAYRYSFQLPISNYSLEFEAELADGSYERLSNPWTLDLKAGDGYIFLIDLNSDGKIETSASKVAGTRSEEGLKTVDYLRNIASQDLVNLKSIETVELKNCKN